MGWSACVVNIRFRNRIIVHYFSCIHSVWYGMVPGMVRYQWYQWYLVLISILRTHFGGIYLCPFQKYDSSLAFQIVSMGHTRLSRKEIYNTHPRICRTENTIHRPNQTCQSVTFRRTSRLMLNIE